MFFSTLFDISNKMNTDYGLGSLKFQLGAYDLNYSRQYGYEYNGYNE